MQYSPWDQGERPSQDQPETIQAGEGLFMPLDIARTSGLNGHNERSERQQ